MTPTYLMGFDLSGGGGTATGEGGVRCLLINPSTGNSVISFRRWTGAVKPLGGLVYTLNTDSLWQTVGEASQDALQRAGVSPKDVAAIAATSMRHALILIDRKGSVLFAIPNRDSRNAAEAMQLAMDYGPDLYQCTGRLPSPIFVAPRLLWLKENEPGLFRSARAALSISDWVAFMLTGEIATEPTQAGETMLFNLKTRSWDADLLKLLNLPGRLLPPLKTSGKYLGKLTKEAATHLALVPGIPVATCGADTPSGLLGAGVLEPGQTGAIAGTALCIQQVTAGPLIDPEMRLWTGMHVLPGHYVLEANAGPMGSVLEWTACLFHGEASDPVARLVAEARLSVPGAHGMSSSIGAQVFNASVLQAPIDSLTFSSLVASNGDASRADLARAVLEGMAFALRANLETIVAVSGSPVNDLVLSGGMTRSSLWTQIVSDVLNQPVRVTAFPEASALGAAICAGVGVGAFKDLWSGSRVLSHMAREDSPGAEAFTYQALYANWQSLRQERMPADMVAASHVVDLLISTPSGGTGPSQPNSFRPHIYVTAEMDDSALERLRGLGEVKYAPYRLEQRLLVGEDLVDELKNYHVFITEVDLVEAESLLRLPDLRLVIVCRSNPVNVDLRACTAASIPVIHTPARNADAVADLTVTFILMLARRLQAATAFLYEPGNEPGDLGRMGVSNEQFHGIELWHRTVGLIGGGAIGRKVIRRLLPFGARILLFDPYLSDEQAVLLNAQRVTLERLLAESDFISLHAPVTDETRGIMNAGAFAHMKSGAFLVNTARAALVDQSALLEALRSGRLGGAALDVFPVEPPGSDDPLLAFPNVIATPHVGGNTAEVAAHQGEMAVQAISDLLTGKPPAHILNEIVLPAFTWTGTRPTDWTLLQKLAKGPGPGATDLDLEAQTKQTIPVLVETQPTPTFRKAEPMSNDTLETMTRILKEFTARIATDQHMIAFAKGKNVVFSFASKDSDHTFFLSFIQGQVAAGLGAPPREPDVRLKMSLDTMDGMFTGRVNATRAATSGKLSFSGDTGKAMAFMRIQKDMMRLYSECRVRIGDPGDLTKAGIASTPAPASQPLVTRAPIKAQPVESYVPVAPQAGKTGDIRDLILMVTNELYAKGLITPTGGNVSARCEDNPTEFWITPSAIFKGDLHPDMLIRIDLDGHPKFETNYVASSEWRVHAAIYKARPEMNSVIHTHAPQATLMAMTKTPFLPISTEAAFLGEVPVVPFIMPGTDELAEAVVSAMGPGFTCLMQNHGLVVTGSSLRRAADMTDVVEVTSHKLMICRQLGVTPPLLPEEIVKQMKEVGVMAA